MWGFESKSKINQIMAKGQKTKQKKSLKKADKKKNPLFEKSARNFRIGNDV